MKHLIVILIVLLSSSSMFATQQYPDILIKDKDTIFLKDFPLEKLELKYRPFGYTRMTAPNTACWRGYIAVWKIEDGKMYLEKIIRCYGDGQTGEEDIIELFKKNGLEFKTKDRMILADWYSQDLYKINSSSVLYYENKVFLYSGWRKRKKEKYVFLRIEKGFITKE